MSCKLTHAGGRVAGGAVGDQVGRGGGGRRGRRRRRRRQAGVLQQHGPRHVRVGRVSGWPVGGGRAVGRVVGRVVGCRGGQHLLVGVRHAAGSRGLLRRQRQQAGQVLPALLHTHRPYERQTTLAEGRDPVRARTTSGTETLPQIISKHCERSKWNVGKIVNS